MSYQPEKYLKNSLYCLFAPLPSVLLSCMLIGSGCGSKNGEGTSCDPNVLENNAGCADGLVCEQKQDGQGACFAPVLIQGHVFDLQTSAPIADARVVALDANGAAASTVGISSADGSYSLRILTQRNQDGSIVAADYTLRSDASGYQSFPGGIRPALPTKVMGTPAAPGLVVSSTLTEIGLIELAAGQRGIVAGRVQASSIGGILIAGGGATAISDRDGSFVLFNVAVGAVTVRGFAAGVQLNPANVNVAAGGRIDGVVLSEANTPLSTVSGSIQLPNAPNVTSTSVLLVLKSTFNMSLERGETPRGLRTAGITGAFSIANVPDGDYVVLAAFENDNAIRDPDPNISGTQIVNITVPAAGGSRTVQLPTSFKVTGALDVRSPGKDQPQAISTPTPTFIWADDSSEDGYQLQVYDSFGTVIFQNPNIPKVSGSPDVSVVYSGPALQPGMFYQFRATSIKAGAPISHTEDLRGVFFLPKP